MERPGSIKSSSVSQLNHQQANQLLKVQKDILEVVVRQNNYQHALEQLCISAEKILQNSAASIMLYNQSRTQLLVRAAPSLPQDAVDQLNGMVPGKKQGSCGTAVYEQTPQFVINTEEDLRWEGLRDFAREFKVIACWSIPIRDSNENVIGSFALSMFEKREANEFYRLLLETAANLASIVLLREKEEEKLQQAAHYDNLTGLPNRKNFYERLEHAIDLCSRKDTSLAILFIDLDNFKQVNDNRGHEAGDKVLQSVAQKMESCLRKEDSLARFGGDEFVLLVEDFGETTELSHIAEKILNAVEKESYGHSHWAISASIGISIYPQDSLNAAQLMQYADKAMYKAKFEGKNKYLFFKSSLSDFIQSRQKLAVELSNAVNSGEIKAYYQPIFELDTERLVGVEVLARWQHPVRGVIGPEEFIPIAEETGLIPKIGGIVTEQALTQCMSWWSQGIPEFKLSINLSARQLNAGAGDELSRMLSETGFPAKNLDVEITESAAMEKSARVVREIGHIGRLGVGVSIDDYGTGSSSIAHLNKLPVSTIKIDRSFVDEITTTNQLNSTAQTIVAMGHSMGISVIAEGVENDEQREYLKKLNCDCAQGYHFCKPLSQDEFRAFLKAS
ncbi:bifunctional diguanylate cyclase/phosphodiesterase [Aliikangiella coralliicola]|uniref:EAL domain-containing protein n=1 Tax=Aliikangiella coralliicola TaxID=2592383 RepID=A0A545UAJ7_9GAMM|nr:EAL domain-containing protein [Aliikangiella coralliicola]TQV86494.1 EAL domain-containing protein [Aliikangiella coralliicola]